MKKAVFFLPIAQKVSNHKPGEVIRSQFDDVLAARVKLANSSST